VLRNTAAKETLQAGRPDASLPPVVATYGKLPLAFEINEGQTDSQVKFLSRGSGYTLFLTGSEAVLAVREPSASRPQGGRIPNLKYGTANPAQRRSTQARPPDLGIRTLDLGLLPIDLRQSAMGNSPAPSPQLQTPAVLRMKLVGANAAAKVVGAEELPGRSNYFLGKDPKKWRTGVANYAKVRYEGVYPGVDVVYYGKQRQIEHDFVVSPGTDPATIKLAIEGADSLGLDKQGNLVAQLTSGMVVLNKPAVYQPGNSNSEIQNPKSVDGRFLLLADNRIGFEIGSYDKTRPLVIDPVLLYSTYLGGSVSDGGYGIAVDAAGSAYVTGYTGSPDFPTANPLQPSLSGYDNAFVAKLNPTGSALVYSTYLGGSGGDIGYGIAVDMVGNAYVAGLTSSSDFPTANPLQDAYGGGDYDGFVAKLSSTGSALVFSTYLGGSGNDQPIGIAVDKKGNAYVTGATSSLDFPTASPLQGAYGGGSFDGFVAKLNSAGSALVYSTYLGGTNEDGGGSIAVDTAGSAYVAGYTGSRNFPTANPLQPSLGGGYDVFVSKLNAAGSALVYSTYLGGGDYDLGLGIAADRWGSAYVTGWTRSANFPAAGAVQGSLLGYQNVFVAKLSSTGSVLVYLTYLGGNYYDGGNGIAVDRAGNAYVTGYTGSSDFPTASPLQPTLGGGYEVFVSKFNAAGSALVYSTYLGGSSGEDYGWGIALDTATNAYVTGYTASHDFPTASPLQGINGGRTYNGFVTKVSPMDVAGAGVSARSVSFGEQKVRTTSQTQTLTLRSVGSKPLPVAWVATLNPSVFKQRNSCARQTLDPGQNCTIDLTFTPKAPGPQTGILLISTPKPLSIPLSGTGIK